MNDYSNQDYLKKDYFQKLSDIPKKNKKNKKKTKIKQPTKKEERDFVKNLSIRQKQYWEIPLKSFEEMYPPIKIKMIKYNFFKRIWIRLTNKKWYELI